MLVTWKDPFVAVNGIVAILVIYCSIASPWKYTRVSGPCSSNWLDVRNPNGVPVCCDDTFQPPCYIGMDELHSVTRGQGAWIMPMVAVLINFGLTMFLPNVTPRHMTALYNRIGLYFVLMVYRTAILYGAFNIVEQAIFPAESSCWYSRLRKNKRCINSFDHADHIVLYMTHFLAISCFEWKILRREKTHLLKRRCLSAWLLCVMFLSIYAIYHTAYSFHSRWENLVGMVLAQIFVMLPLYLLSENHWATRGLGIDLFLSKPLEKL
ncbi:hypothetical protein THRCLA_11781 [Thraustotheca clavata]|uniref:Uncharacterized protein n=1 Tax=Thraustotheca clavata TaxID=74557 RepID=A0A1V9Y6P9_9STRA|nr:hypothetical protein THRCLA_11781 [Thraustotheca clavata]